MLLLLRVSRVVIATPLSAARLALFQRLETVECGAVGFKLLVTGRDDDAPRYPTILTTTSVLNWDVHGRSAIRSGSGRGNRTRHLGLFPLLGCLHVLGNTVLFLRG